MRTIPRVLKVETGYLSEVIEHEGWDTIDYHVYKMSKVPHWWRKIEEALRTDLYLAWRTKQMANRYDIIYTASEKIAIPLTLLGVKKPLVVSIHHMTSRKKRAILRCLGIVKRWAGIGYVTTAERDFMLSYYEVKPERLFQSMTAKIDRFFPNDEKMNPGPIMSVGVAKRDYNFLIDVLRKLPDYQTEIFVTSRYGDVFSQQLGSLPDWVQFKSGVSDEELVRCYQRSRFVVVPLINTTQYTAGSSVILEASASGKAVIATKNPGTATYILDGVTGILVPPDDRVSLQAAIEKLWKEPELAHRMGLAGRKYMEENFNPSIVNEHIEDFFRQLCESSKSH